MESVLAREPLTLAILVTGTVAAAMIDLRTGRIPNLLTGSLAGIGFVLAAAGAGRLDVGAAVAGCGVGLMLMLPGYLLGATGGGDVKLVAAAGTLLGPWPSLWAVLFTLVAGGAIAVIVAMCRRTVWLTFYRLAFLVQTAGLNKAEIEHSAAGNRFAFGPAIAIGTIIAAISI
jgi:prepilin peptidase CpaA